MEDTERGKTVSIQELISSSIDDELSEFEQRRLLQLLDENEDQATWERYQLISDVLQGHFPQHLGKDFSTRVMAEIAGESDKRSETDTNDAPVKKSKVGRNGLKQGLRFAIAASVAVVAIMVVQQVRVDSGDKATVEELAIAQPMNDTVPQIAPVAADHSEQIPLHYSATDSSANTQLVESSQPVTVRPSLLKAEQSEQTNDLRMLDPYIMNHAEVAAERVMSPYMDTQGSDLTEDK